MFHVDAQLHWMIRAHFGQRCQGLAVFCKTLVSLLLQCQQQVLELLLWTGCLQHPVVLSLQPHSPVRCVCDAGHKETTAILYCYTILQYYTAILQCQNFVFHPAFASGHDQALLKTNSVYCVSFFSSGTSVLALLLLLLSSLLLLLLSLLLLLLSLLLLSCLLS
jgi:hypothetical protein